MLGIAATRTNGDWRDTNGVKHTKDASIFSLSNPISTKSVTTNSNYSTSTSSFVDDNIFATLNQWHKTGTVQTKSNNSTKSNEPQEYDASSGRAAAADLSGQTDDLNGQIKGTEGDFKTVTSFGKSAIKLDTSVQANDKKYQKQVEKEQANLLATQKQMTKIIEENNQLSAEVTKAQDELASLQSSGQGGERVGELQTLIGSKVGLLQQNGKTVYSLSRTSARSIRRMNSANKAYINTQKYNAKVVDQQETSSQKILDVAGKIEQYSALTAQAGKLLNLAGMGLIAMGSAMSWAPGLGAALVAAGQVMSKIGKVAELVGNYGQTAANLTKTAAYAAEGNLMGAMQSIGAAMQTGCAAAKGTKTLKADLAAIDTKANDALNKVASDDLAKKQAEEMKKNTLKTLREDGQYKELVAQATNEKGEFDAGKFEDLLNDQNGKNWVENQAFNGMTEKQFRQSTSANLQQMMRDGDITAAHKGNKIKRVNELIQNGKGNGQITQYNSDGTIKKLADGTIVKESGDFTDIAAQRSTTSFENAVRSGGGAYDVKTGNVVSMDKDKLKAITKKAKTSFGTVSYTPPKGASATDLINSFQSGMTTMASMFGMNPTGGYQMPTTKAKRPVSYTMNPRIQQIMEKNQRHMASRAGYAHRAY